MIDVLRRKAVLRFENCKCMKGSVHVMCVRMQLKIVGCKQKHNADECDACNWLDAEKCTVDVQWM